MTRTIHLVLPAHLRTLGRISSDVSLDIEEPITIGSILDALEARYPMLQGTLRDHVTKKRRDFVRFFACSTDWSHEPHDAPLPEDIVEGREPFLIVGAVAGGLQ